MTACGKLYRKDINIGCGGFYSSEWLGIDKDKDSFARVLHDLDNSYLPFKDKCVSFIMIKCTIAHVKYPKKLIEECKRVAVHGIGMIACGNRCKKHKKKYNKDKLILLTNDPVLQKECIEKYKYWLDSEAESLGYNKSKREKYVKMYPYDITNEYNPFRTQNVP